MWSNIILNGNKSQDDETDVKSQSSCHPPSRYKHSCVLVPAQQNSSEEPSSSSASSNGGGGSNNNYDLYLYGGRSGTFPLKDFWKLDLRLGKWEEIKALPTGDDCWPSHLQEHSMIYFERKIYVFGGEISFSYGEDLSPLWIYSLDSKTWRRWGLQTPEKGSSKMRQVKSPDLSRQTKTPVGRRGHSAVVWNNYMLIYGGYRDLKGSLGDLWAFHFDTESWHLFSSPEMAKKDSRPWYFFPTPGSFSSSSLPSPRHSHISVLHGSSLYVHGGMQDLIELQDLWKFCLKTRKWTNLKAKNGPGPLHGHVGVCALDSLLIMSGERAGKSVDEFWRFDFLSEEWERIVLNGCRPCPRICAWGGMLPMVMKRVDGAPSTYKRFPGQFDDLEHLEVASSSTEGNNSNDGTKYWWDYDDDEESHDNFTNGRNSSRITQATNPNIQIQVTNAPPNGNGENQTQPPRKSSLFSELARFPFTSGGAGDYQALSESNSVCLSEEETSPRPDGKDRSKWNKTCPQAQEEEIQFEPICPEVPEDVKMNLNSSNLPQNRQRNEPLIDLGGDGGGGGATRTPTDDSSPEESSSSAVVLDGDNSLITFDTPVCPRTTKYAPPSAATVSSCSSGVGTRPLSASSATRRSESANCLQLSQRAGSAGSNKQSVKKSASVRFADVDESGRRTNGGGRNGGNDNGGNGGGYSRSSSQHQLVLRECTSDYSSMDNGLNYNQQQQQQQRNANVNGNSGGCGFENPNYRGSGSSTLFSAAGGANNGSSKNKAEYYEMGNLNPSSKPKTSGVSAEEGGSAFTSRNGVELSKTAAKSDVMMREVEEDSRRPVYFEVSTPNYMLLIGGNESHSSQVVSKRQPLSIWRLRVTSHLFSAPSPTQNYPRGVAGGVKSDPYSYPTYSNSVLSNSNSINRSMMKVNPNHTTGF